MILVVTGGRDYNNRGHVYDCLDRRWPVELVMHGACPVGTGGADLLAQDWARHREVSYWGTPAKFRTSTLGRGAGPLRNTAMLRDAQYWASLRHARLEVVAFPGDRGTRNCVQQAVNMHLYVQPCCEHHPLPLTPTDG
jgi:SLOG family YspA-like protein